MAGIEQLLRAFTVPSGNQLVARTTALVVRGFPLAIKQGPQIRKPTGCLAYCMCHTHGHW